MAIAVEPELPEVEAHGDGLDKIKVDKAKIERDLVEDKDKKDRRGRIFGSFSSTLPFVFVIVLWLAVDAIFDPGPTRLVPPQQVLGSFFELVREGTLPAYIAQSVGRLALSGSIALAVGIPLGWVLGLDKDIGRAAEPMLRFFNAISGIAWLPLAIVWFGFTDRTIGAIIIYTMIFPVIFNTMIGVRTIPTVLRDASRSMGSSWFRVIRDVYIPGSFPSVMTGLRLGIGFGWRALIAGEFVVGGGGIGFLIFNARVAGLIERVMLGMIVLGAVWLLMDRLILRPIEEFTNNRWGLLRS